MLCFYLVVLRQQNGVENRVILKLIAFSYQIGLNTATVRKKIYMKDEEI